MIFIEHSRYGEDSVKTNMGAPQYSYYFVRKAFAPALDRLGRRIGVTDPDRQVDTIYGEAFARGEDCVFLSYSPPHTAAVSDVCPTLPVFAWEYDTIPAEIWDDNPRHDWRTTLSRTAGAITLSVDSAAAVRRVMGEDYPVWPIPCPLFDSYARGETPASGWRAPTDLQLDGALAVNARDIDLRLFRPDSVRKRAVHALRLLNRAASEQKLEPVSLQGAIYTSVLSPADDRKNWRGLIAGFVWAFQKNPDATLVIKLTHANIEDGIAKMLSFISVLPPFECNIVLIQGMLSSEAYNKLIEATSYYVNTSTAEGQCLPLTEYMSSGRPALAPAHSSLLDYVTPDNAFLIRSDEEPTLWPHDERGAIRACHHLISFADLMQQFRESFRVAANDPARYQRMSRAAVRTMQAFCSEEVVAGHLKQAIECIAAARRVAQAG